MTTANPAYVAAYRRALAKKGVQITFTRVDGFPPNVATTSATVTAMVQDYQPDGTSVAETDIAVSKLGAITQGDRMIIVLGDDLAEQRFPLPLQKNDQVMLVDTKEVLNVTAVDGLKRAAAGAIELKAAGIA